MIILQEYNVSADGKWLTIDAKANPSLTGVYISNIKISLDGSFTDSAVAVFNALLAATGLTIAANGDVNVASFRVKLDVDTIGKKGPFYIRIVATDPQGSATTCAHKNTVNAVTFNKYPFYKVIACSAHQIQGCDIPKEFIDYMMQLKALEASIAIMDVDSINKYYKWLVTQEATGSISTTPFTRTCGCQS